MKFLYEYRTKDNAVHSGEIVAPTRDAAYADLKAKGIRPSRLAEAPGFFNKLFGKGKRWLAIGVLCAVCLVLCAVALRISHQAQSTRHKAQLIENDARSPLHRHQVYGDPALMAEFARTDYASVFPLAGDRFLARYAQPGHYVAPTANLPSVAAALREALSTNDAAAVVFRPDDPREARELKRIVLGMRAELRRYLANGIGTAERYIGRLADRQKREVMLYGAAKADLQKTKDPVVWERINTSLRNAGLMTILPPDSEEPSPENPR